MTDYFVRKGRRYVQAKPFCSTDASIVVMGSVQYALGRRSYSPSATMDFCRENWTGLTKNARCVIMRDVLEWLGSRHDWVVAGQYDSAYPEDWRKFLTWCFAQDKWEAQLASEACMRKRAHLLGVDEFFDA